MIARYARAVMDRPKPPERSRPSVGASLWRRLSLRSPLFIATALALAVLALAPASRHLRAATLLVRLAAPEARGFLLEAGRHTVDVHTLAAGTLAAETHEAAPGAGGARLYVPRGVPNPPGIVLVHGVHHLGVTEPRLVRFAETLAAAGIVVLTPHVAELADYRVDAASVDTIGEAARSLSSRVKGRKVGLVGMSFAGGLAILTAADPRYAGVVGFVTAVGAHHDLERVSRFFATNTVVHPDGTSVHLAAHPYGPLVLVHAHVEDFFPRADAEAAREALRLWLSEERDAARARALALSEPSRAVMNQLFDQRTDGISPALLRAIEARSAALRAVSPHGRLAHVRAPIFLLHGAGDTVIPAAETEWLAAEAPSDRLEQALVSRALVHVELEGAPDPRELWALVRFMAEMLEAAER